MRVWRLGSTILAFLVGALVVAVGARADEPPAAPPRPAPDVRPRPPEPPSPLDPAPDQRDRPPPPPPPPGPTLEGGIELPTFPDGPAPDVRGRPVEPPPPGGALADWDKDFRSRGVELGPPLPPPDPWEPRPILWRHDVRDVSLDARIKPVKRVPQWVDVVERRDLTEWRPMDLGDFARRLPNVVVADGGSPFLQFPVIRGLSGQRIKVLTDGVWPTTDVLGIQGTPLSLWDPESTERMEVYHGPGAYLKGLDSPGGMINIVPRRPRRHGRLSADVTGVAAYDSATRAFRGRAEADIGQDRVAGLVGFTWTQRGDRRIGGGAVLDSTSYDQYAADLALDYFLDNRSRIGITAQYVSAQNVQSPFAVASSLTKPSYDRFFLALSLSSFDVGGIFGGTKASIALDTLLSDSDDSFGGQSSGIAGEDDASRYQFDFQGNLYINPCHDTWAELILAYARLKRTEQVIGDCSALCDPVDQAPDGGAVGGLSLGDCGGASTLIGRVLDGTTFADVGACEGLRRTYEAEELLVTLLVEDQFHNECWDTHAGIRLDLYHVADNRVGTDETHILVGGAGGVARHLSPCVTVYANGSAGWRRPTLDEQNATAVIDGVTVFGNPDLDPEFNANAEVGLKSSLRDRASLQATAFGHYVDKFIGQVEAPPLAGPTAILDNLGDVILYGGELTAAWRPWNTLEGAELYGTAGITRSTDTVVVANVPFLWRTGVRYSVPQPRGYRVRRWFADAALYGATNSRDGVRGGASFVTGEVILGTGLDFGDYHSAWLNLGVRNLFDTEYTPPASRLSAPGLSFFANLQVDM